MKIVKIVITGGPCGGKTTAMNWIRDAFSKEGYTVLFVPESATQLIVGGVSPTTCGTNADFQICLSRLQIATEDAFYKGGCTMPADRLLLVCDRGVMDNRAYMSEEEFDAVQKALGVTEKELLDRYDAVFHLVTAADGAENFYTTANNTARSETPAEAISLDEKLRAVWSAHPSLSVIDNSTDFKGKMERLIDAIGEFLAL